LVYAPFSLLVLIPLPPRSTPFPYTTLFRSPADDRLLVAPCDHGVDQLVRPAVGEVVVVEPQPAQVLHVVRCLEVEAAGVLARKADRKSTRLNSSHVKISYAVFCLKKKNLVL